MSLERVIEIARRELGYTESPAGSNCTKYGAAYGLQGQPWCVIFLWWVFRQAGESAAFFGGAKTASCGKLLRWYREQGQTVPASEVQPGDIVILNFHGTKDTEHCGLVVETPVQNGKQVIYTVEGNTSRAGSQDNGGMVCEKTRYPDQIVGVCRPKYEGTPPPAAPEPPQEGAGTGDGPSSGASRHLPPGEGKETVEDITGHWAEDAIRRCVEKGLMRGYEDGSFQPDKPVTRAELATVLKRLWDKQAP